MRNDEWEADPELRQLRSELIDTFPARRAELDSRLAMLARGQAGKAECLEIHVAVHKLAGAASSYGLMALGSLAEALDDLLGAELATGKEVEGPLDRLPERVALLSRALEEAYLARGDAPRAAASAEGRKLISDAESLLSGASSGSSSDPAR